MGKNKLDQIISKSIKKIISEASINAKKRNVDNVINAFKKGKRGYNAIKTMAVFTAENPDSQAMPTSINKKLNHSLLNALKLGNYVAFRVKGCFGNIENPYMVINISPESAAMYCGKFQQTSFVFHILNEDGSLHSEYWEKADVDKPYNLKQNPYIKKDESDGWINQEDASDGYTIIGDKFKYTVPFPIFEEVDETINENLTNLVQLIENKGGTASKQQLLEFSIYKVGQSPFMYRKQINKGLL